MTSAPSRRSPFIWISASALGLVAGVIFHRAYWLEPSTPPHTPAASTIDSTPLAGETSDAEPLPLAPPVPPTDHAHHPAAVAEFQKLAQERGATEEALELAASGLGRADLPDLLTQLSPRVSKEVRAALLDRWAELDPRAAADFLLTRKAEAAWKDEQFLESVLTAWLDQPHEEGSEPPSSARRDEVLAWIRGLPYASQRTAWLAALRQLALSDPEVAIRLFTEVGRGDPSFVDTRFFTNLAECDPARALELAARQRGDNMTEEFILQRWASKAPQTALAWVRTRAANRPELTTYLFTWWGRYDPSTAFEVAGQLPPGEERRRALASSAGELATTDLPRVQAWLDRLPMDPWRQSITVQIAAKLTNEHPAQAAALILTLPPSQERNRHLSDTIASWAMVQPPDAAALILKVFPPGETRLQALNELSPWAQQDPGAALNWLLREAPEAHDAIASALRAGAIHRPEATLDWIKAQPPSAERRTYYSDYLRQQARRDPRRAAAQLAAWGDAEMPAPVESIAFAWADQDPAGAAAWASQLPDVKLRQAAYARIAGRWGDRNPDAARAWIEQLPAGEERDIATEQFSQWTYSRDPALAAHLGATIADPVRRWETLQKVFPYWQRDNSAAAARFLESAASPLSPEERAALRAIPPQP